MHASVFDWLFNLGAFVEIKIGECGLEPKTPCMPGKWSNPQTTAAPIG